MQNYVFRDNGIDDIESGYLSSDDKNYHLLNYISYNCTFCFDLYLYN